MEIEYEDSNNNKSFRKSVSNSFSSPTSLDSTVESNTTAPDVFPCRYCLELRRSSPQLVRAQDHLCKDCQRTITVRIDNASKQDERRRLEAMMDRHARSKRLLRAKSSVYETPQDEYYDQLHPVETEKLRREKRKELEHWLQHLNPDTSKSLRQAQQKCPKIVETMTLLFLRCEVFHADLAAHRMARYWDQRIELFGTEKAFLPLTQKGALRDDWDVLQCGYLRSVEHTDPSGRSIVFCDSSVWDGRQHNRTALARTLWYVLHSVLEHNETTQQRGIVLVVYPKDPHFYKFDPQTDRLLIRSLQNCLPVRVAAIHLCHPPPPFRISMPVVTRIVWPLKLRKRIWVHCGSKERVLKKLQKFGLSVDVLPTELGGSVKLDHSDWLENQRIEENTAV